MRAKVRFEKNIRALVKATIASGVCMAPLGADTTVIPRSPEATWLGRRRCAQCRGRAHGPTSDRPGPDGQEIVAALVCGFGRPITYQDVSEASLERE
ncbi:hypothetical protein OHA25_07900 [Nonomuraea sp. NBC_00507]|uniref:hypothetical protein n=1 Tax=Nonomuraea sp. NBC_00507 TaxID=2976002 RepID=UPI002E19D00C